MERSYLRKFAWQWGGSIVAERNYPASKLSKIYLDNNLLALSFPKSIQTIICWHKDFPTFFDSNWFAVNFHNII